MLLSLPGVGRKTANILLGMLLANRQLGLTLDVMRLSQRLGLTQETDPDTIEADLTRVVSPAQRVRFCHLLQYHGRGICIARNPNVPSAKFENYARTQEKMI
jgi:endonuclease-3